MPTKERKMEESTRPARTEGEGMRLAIVGCGGFTGSHLLDALLDYDSVLIDRGDPQVEKISRHLSNPHLNIRQNSLSSAELPEFREAIRAADAVINLAAICNPSEYNVYPIQPVKIVDICVEQRKWLIPFPTS
jgi:UDP-apiose/xylose synthase